MFEYLAITDGTTTLDLTDNIDYALVSYAPRIASIRKSELGGHGPYTDVVDQITVHARGCTAAQAYAAAAALQRMLDQAWLWWRDGVGSAVTLLAKAQYTTITKPLRAIVYGNESDGGGGTMLPAVWHEYFGRYIIENITIQFTREGEWLSATSDTAASASATFPTIHTATFATAASVFSPIDVSVGGFTAASLFNLQVGYCLVAPANRLLLVEGENMTGSSSGTGTATPTTVADAAFLASAGNVRRWTGTTTFTGTIRNLTGFVTVAIQQSVPIAVFAAVRFNSSTITGSWQVEGWINGALVVQGELIPITYASNRPQIVNLGSIQNRGGIDALALSFIGTLPVGTTFDIDYIVAIRMDDAASHVIGTVDYVSTRLSVLPGATAVALEIRNTPQPDGLPSVVLYDAVNALTDYIGYVGDPSIVMTGTTVGFTLLSTGSGPSGVGNAWRPATTAAGAAIASVVTVTRRTAYMLPE